ncbi:MAG: class II glutamine amidotransferase [Nanoarchaeota archaeon]
MTKMCRMLVASGNFDVNSLIDSVILMAKNENEPTKLADEPKRFTHPDGWGLAYLSDGRWIVKKSTKAIFKDPSIDKLRNIKTNLLIIHVRKKVGSEISIENTHPFQIEHPVIGSCVFCHNGFIEEKIFFDQRYKPKGKTDSEKLFYSILTDFDRTKDIRAAIRINFQRYHPERGTNIIFATKTKTYVGARENNLPKYYQMSIGKDGQAVVISSERLKTLPGFYWKVLPQGSIAVIKNGAAICNITSKNSFMHRLRSRFRL